VKLTAVVPESVAREVARRAQLSGLAPSRWVGQVVESFIAGERCQHGARPPAAPAAADHGEADA
jgi:hypothetical protein